MHWKKAKSPNNSTLFNTVELADLNNDGRLDIVTGYDGQGLYIWIGLPNGSYEFVTTPPATIGNYNELCVGDINNDGKPDIAGSRGGGLSVWFGDGTGTGWGPQTGPAATGTFNGVTFDDVNNDGNLDLVTSATGTGARKGVQVYLGNGNGGWSAGDTNMPLSVKYNAVDTGDFNNDGKIDIVAAGDNGVDAWTGNGAGTWTLSDSGLPSSGTYSDVELADFDLDGSLDIVATGGNNNGVMVIRGNGAGLWTITFNLPLGNTYTSVETCDVNIDGYMDIITTSSNTNQTIWTGDGAFNWFQQNSGLTSSNFYIEASIGDVNKDGRIDMCMVNTVAGLEVWESEVQRTVNLWTPYSTPNLPSNTVNDIEVFDINLDGKQDICYATQTNGVQIFTGNGAGTWTTFPSPVTTGPVFKIICTDYNIDGKPDIIVSQNNGIHAWRGNGAGTWVQTSSGLPSTAPWYGLAAADYNDDGKIDIAGGSGANAGIFVWNGNGAGLWTITLSLPFTGTYFDIDSADVNMDGSIDLLVADGGIRAFMGNSNDGWSESSTGLPGSSSQYKTVAAADISGDSVLDLVGASETLGTQVWQRSGSTWSLHSSVNSTHGTGIAASDFNIDGDSDVCLGSGQNLGLAGISNSGGSWSMVSDGLNGIGNFLALELADINIDGRLDIITYNNTGQNTNIWIGDYAAPLTQTFSIGPLAVGWNLVSMPLVPLNSSLPDVLYDMDADTTWDKIQYYNPNDSMDPWKSFVEGKPIQQQDLTQVNESLGLWIRIPDLASLGDGYIRVEGTEPVTSNINLKSGWNLVGYPSAQARLASATLPGQVDMVSVFQASSPYISDISDLSSVTMQTGKAYWVHCMSDTVWTVDY